MRTRRRTKERRFGYLFAIVQTDIPSNFIN